MLVFSKRAAVAGVATLTSLVTGCNAIVGNDDVTQDVTDAAPPPDGGDAPPVPPPDAADVQTTPVAHVRVAHLSPDFGPLDFCLALHGTGAFTGPVLRGLGSTQGITYPSATRYLDVAAGQYDLRLVAHGAADCSASLGGTTDFTNMPPVAAGGYATFAAMGSSKKTPATFTVTGMLDDAAVDSAHAKLRVVNAFEGEPKITFGSGGGMIFDPMLVGIPFGGAPSGTGIDANGYLDTAGLQLSSASARASTVTTQNVDIVTARNVFAAPGSLTTVFVVGSYGSTPALLACTDNGTPVGPLTPCNGLGDAPSYGRFRFVDLVTDVHQFDFCVRSATEQSFDGKTPVLGKGGFPLPLMYRVAIGWQPLPENSYVLRLVPAGRNDCTTGVAPDFSFTSRSGVFQTIAVMGNAAPTTGEAALSLRAFTDDVTGVPNVASVRFIHALSADSQTAFDLADVTSPMATSYLFVGSTFGAISSAGSLGYFETTPRTASLQVQVSKASTAVTSPIGVSLRAGQPLTIFAIGAPGSASTPPALLFCSDDGTMNAACM